MQRHVAAKPKRVKTATEDLHTQDVFSVSVCDNRKETDILNVSVSDRFDLLQRVKQRETELTNFFRVRGPDAFPKREAKRPSENALVQFYGADAEDRLSPEFTLDDFIQQNPQIPRVKSKAHVVSSHTWDHFDKKLLQSLSDVDKKVLEGKFIGDSEPLPEIPAKRPWRLKLLEENQAEEDGDSTSNPLDPLQPGYSTSASSHELELIEDILRSLPGDEEFLAESKLSMFERQLSEQKSGHGSRFLLPTSRDEPRHACDDTAYYQHYQVEEAEFVEDMYGKFGTPGASLEDATVRPSSAMKMRVTLPTAEEVDAVEEASASPSAKSSGGCEVTPADLAIMNCLAQGGTKLDLKAHFMSFLRPLNASLTATLTHVNLSFNELTAIPVQLFQATELRFVNLRNNPITDISSGVATWRNLKSLNMAFCYITVLPQSLFELSMLEILDVSYNHIVEIPVEISKLRILKELYCDGNEIGAFPRHILSLSHLKVLRCANNYTHKLFWRHTAVPQPQKLLYSCATAIKHLNLDTSRLSKELRDMLERHKQCDFCSSWMYGGGLPVVKPALELFGIHFLPVLFRVCSHNCRRHLRKAEQLSCLNEEMVE